MTAMEVSPKLFGMDKWEVENAARTLREAYELANKPKLLEAAKKLLKQQQVAGKKAISLAENL